MKRIKDGSVVRLKSLEELKESNIVTVEDGMLFTKWKIFDSSVKFVITETMKKGTFDTKERLVYVKSTGIKEGKEYIKDVDGNMYLMDWIKDNIRGMEVKLKEMYAKNNALLSDLNEETLIITRYSGIEYVELSHKIWLSTDIIEFVEDRTPNCKFKVGDKVMMTSKKAREINKEEYPSFVEPMEEFLDMELEVKEVKYIERGGIYLITMKGDDISYNFKEDWLEYYDINKLKAERFEELSESMYVLRGDLWGRDLRVQPNSATLDYFIKSVRDDKSIVWFENTEYFDYGVTMRLKEVKELAEYLNKIVELAEEVK